MSDDERSDLDSEASSDDLSTTGLIATRQKRATAGNLYATLRANLDDEELQKELLAEDEDEDAGDYEGSDKDDDDEALESSSEDEDAGPPQGGDPEDLEGEKALKRQEREEARKKRKAVDARLKLPAWHQKKRVKLADDAKTDDGSTSERPKKKSERSNWLPSAADAPVRQSGRALAVANREIVHANLKQSAARSEKQRRVMKDAAERERGKRRFLEISQEDRLKKCERIERETAREFGRWEREEAERQRLRDEALAAKRRRGIDGPVTKYWSGSVVWEGDKIRILRVSHGSRDVDKIVFKERKEIKEGSDGKELATASVENKAGENKEPVAGDTSNTAPDTNRDPSPQLIPSALSGPNPEAQQPAPTAASNPPTSQNSVPWLQGIEEYAAQTEPAEPVPAIASTPAATTLGNAPSAPATNGQSTPTQHPQQLPPQPPNLGQPAAPPILYPAYPGWPPGSHQFAVQPQVPMPPPPPPVPLIREQAQRSLVILENFPSLSTTQPTKRTPKYKQEATILESDPLKSLLLPNSHPSFTAEESKYLLSRSRKRNNEFPLPPPPARQRCAVTSWPAKFRDPKTGLAYADMHQYKIIQRVLAGGCQWSVLLGCWVGPEYGAIGRPANGVPKGFASAPVIKVEANKDA